MERSCRPASESYPSACFSVQAGHAGDEDDHAPIFSLSKSSVDVVMATGSLHKLDPTWRRLDLKRSSSTNTHSDQNSVTTLQQLRHHKWRQNNRSFTTQNEDLLSPPPLSGRWISNMNRWSGCSGSMHSGSSTPDTVVWKDEPSGHNSPNQEAPNSSAPHSPQSKINSPPSTPSHLVFPFHTPTLPVTNCSISSSSPLRLSTEELPGSSPYLQLTSAESRGSSERLVFQFPSPVPSPVSSAHDDMCSDPASFVDGTITRQSTPDGSLLLEEEKAKSSQEMLSNSETSSPVAGQEIPKEPSSFHLVGSQQVKQSISTEQGFKLSVVSSFSDSLLSRRCSFRTWDATTAKLKRNREEGTMTSQLQMVEAAVQTTSPLGSWCDLRKSMSPSNTSSHSILGSPPGSRLNLRSPVGSHSNLVSPSSSMFPGSSCGEKQKQEENPELDATSVSSHHLERKRSCLKIQPEGRDELGRRSSMKQVQWDEDGLTWDVYGASLDPEELSSVIQKHLERKSSFQPVKRSSKKMRAPKPPVIANLITTMAPDMSPPAMSIKCMVDGESEDTIETIGAAELQQGAESEKTIEAPRRRSRAEKDNPKDTKGKVCGDQVCKSPSQESENSKKKTVIKSLRRPRWCGSSRKTDE